MSYLFSFNVYIIHFGTGLAFLLAFLKFYEREKGEPLERTIYVSLCIGSIILRFGQYATGYLQETPFAFFLLLTSILALGPFILFLAMKMLDFALPKKRLPIFYHFIPAILMIIFEVYFQLLPEKVKVDALKIALNQTNTHWINILVFFAIIHIEIYLIYLYFIYQKIKKNNDISYDQQAYLILFIPISGICILGIGYFLKITLLFHIGADLLVLTTIMFYMIPAKLPSFFDTLQQEIQARRYEKTQLTGINVEAVKERLHVLIEVNKVYQDENLRLNNLAEELLITPHQLSRIINEHYNQNFNEFINSYRIKEAKKKLVQEKENTILVIASEVGFNTKSAFNSQFQKFTGTSPTEYRKKKLKIK